MSDLPSNWDSLRRKRLKRDTYECANCSAKGGPYGNAELHAHHIVPRKDGGSNSIENLKTLCKDCHDAIHHENKTAPTGSTKRDRSASEDPVATLVSLCIVGSGFLVVLSGMWQRTVMGFWVGGVASTIPLVGVWAGCSAVLFVTSSFLSAYWDSLPTTNPLALMATGYLWLYLAGSGTFLVARLSVDGPSYGFRESPPIGVWFGDWLASGMELWLTSTAIAVVVLSLVVLKVRRLMNS